MNYSLFVDEHNGGFTVETAHSNIPVHTARSQADAIAWAKKVHPEKPCHVAYVDHPDKLSPDQWRRISCDILEGVR